MNVVAKVPLLKFYLNFSNSRRILLLTIIIIIIHKHRPCKEFFTCFSTPLSLCSRLASFAVSWAWHSILQMQRSCQKLKSLEKRPCISFETKNKIRSVWFKWLLECPEVGPTKGAGLQGCPICHCRCVCFRNIFCYSQNHAMWMLPFFYYYYEHFLCLFASLRWITLCTPQL